MTGDRLSLEFLGLRKHLSNRRVVNDVPRDRDVSYGEPFPATAHSMAYEVTKALTEQLNGTSTNDDDVYSTSAFRPAFNSALFCHRGVRRECCARRGQSRYTDRNER